jgi:hypothetical protein
MFLRTTDTRRLLLTGGLLLLLPTLASAEPLSLSADTSLWSRYMWRGLRFSDGAVIQSSVTGAMYGFSANIWTNYDLRAGKINEIDPTISYSCAYKEVTLGAGWTHFGVIDGDDDDEFYVSISLANLPLAPTLTCYWDVNLGTGAYIQGSVSHSFTLTESMSLTFSGAAGYVVDDSYMGVNANGMEFSDWFSGDLQVALPVVVAPGVTIQPKAGYSFPLSQQGKEAINGYGYGTNSCTFYGAVVISAVF